MYFGHMILASITVPPDLFGTPMCISIIGSLSFRIVLEASALLTKSSCIIAINFPLLFFDNDDHDENNHHCYSRRDKKENNNKNNHDEIAHN